jgi:hypothetical protein
MPADGPAERLSADDERAKGRILGIDLSIYDELAVVPSGEVNWPLERKKVLFLQTALRCGVPWRLVVQFTQPHFGPTLESPPVPVVGPIVPPSFTPPAFDIARQTPEDWARAADEAWTAYRQMTVLLFRDRCRGLVEVERPRRASGIAGQKKAPIPDEAEVVVWAVLAYFSASLSEPIGWSRLAEMYPLPDTPTCPAPEVRRARRRRADQIATRVMALLTELGLPLPE